MYFVWTYGQGRPCQRWAKKVDENVRTLGIRNWRQAASDRAVWRHKVAEDPKFCLSFCNFFKQVSLII